MKCKELESNAIEYLDGKLAPPQRNAVEAHLAVCPACRERVHGFTQMLGLLDEWQNVEPSPFFQTRLTARLQAEAVSPSWWSSLWQPHAPALPVPSAAEGSGAEGFRPVTGSLFAVALAVVMTVAVAVLRYSPSPAPLDASEGTNSQAVTVAFTADDLPLYQDLPLLEDYEVLRNFEVLQVLSSTNPGMR